MVLFRVKRLVTGSLNGVEVMALRDGDELLERQKELQCLYRIAELTEDLDGENPSVAVGSAALPSLPSAQMLQHCVDVLPASWQWPSAARARIDIGEAGRFEFAFPLPEGSSVFSSLTLEVDGSHLCPAASAAGLVSTR